MCNEPMAWMSTVCGALADQLRDKLKSGVVALGAANDGKVSLLVIVTKDLIDRLKAGDLIK